MLSFLLWRCVKHSQCILKRANTRLASSLASNLLCLLSFPCLPQIPLRPYEYVQSKLSSKDLRLPAVCEARCVTEPGISLSCFSAVALAGFQGYLPARCVLLLSIIMSVLQLTRWLCQPESSEPPRPERRTRSRTYSLHLVKNASPVCELLLHSVRLNRSLVGCDLTGRLFYELLFII